MGEESEQLRREIEATRRELGTDVDALTEKVSPKRVVERRVDRARDAVGSLKEKVMGTTSDATSSAGNGLSSAASSIGDATGSAVGSVQGAASSATSSVADTASSTAQAARRLAGLLAAARVAAGAGGRREGQGPGAARPPAGGPEGRRGAVGGQGQPPGARAAGGAVGEGDGHRRGGLGQGRGQVVRLRGQGRGARCWPAGPAAEPRVRRLRTPRPGGGDPVGVPAPIACRPGLSRAGGREDHPEDERGCGRRADGPGGRGGSAGTGRADAAGRAATHTRHHPVAVPADRRLRLPVRLRDDGTGGPERRGRVAVRATAGLPERLRRDTRPGCRLVPAGSGRGRGAAGPPLPARHAGAGDQLERRRGLDHRARRPARRALAGQGPGPVGVPAAADGLRRRARARAHRPVRQRRGPAADGVRAGVRLRDAPRDLGAHRVRLPPGDGAGGERQRPATDAEHGPAAGLRGAARRRPYAAEGGRGPLLRAVVERREAAQDVQAGVQAAHLDGTPLAALAGRRPHPGPPVEDPPRPQRTDPQGPQLRAHRRDRGRRDDVAAGDAGRRAQLRLPVQLDPGLDLRAVGPLHAQLRLGGDRLLPLHHRRGGAGRRPADRVRRGRRAGPGRAGAAAPARVRGGAAGPGRQRGLPAAAERRVGRGARLGLPAHEVA